MWPQLKDPGRSQMVPLLTYDLKTGLPSCCFDKSTDIAVEPAAVDLCMFLSGVID